MGQKRAPIAAFKREGSSLEPNLELNIFSPSGLITRVCNWGTGGFPAAFQMIPSMGICSSVNSNSPFCLAARTSQYSRRGTLSVTLIGRRVS